jgi:hypothetical protein
MEPAKRVQSQDEEALGKLLEEGARSYPGAVTTIIAYWHEVEKKCRKVLKARLTDYSRAIGIDLAPENIGAYSFPDPDKWDATDVSVGITLSGNPTPEGISGWDSYCCLGWESSDPTESWFGVWVGAWLQPKKLTKLLHGKMTGLAKGGIADLNASSDLVWIRKMLQPEDAARFEIHLDELLRTWIQFWERIGGLKGIIS